MRPAIRLVAEIAGAEELADLLERSDGLQVPNSPAGLAGYQLQTKTMQMVADLVAERLGR